MPFPDSFSTARLQAERLTAAHEAELQRMHRDATTMAYLGGARDDEFTKAYLKRNLLHWDTFGFGVWILRDIGGGEPIGRGVLRHRLVDDFDEVEVGYAFYPPYWGRGLATEITRACLEFGHDIFEFETMIGVTHPHNFASQHVLRKCGLVYEREFDYEGAPSSLFRTASYKRVLM